MNTLHSRQRQLLLQLLVEARASACLSQNQVCMGLDKRHQSYLAKVETGARRLDVIEFLAICQVLRANPHMIIRRVCKLALIP